MKVRRVTSVPMLALVAFCFECRRAKLALVDWHELHAGHAEAITNRNDHPFALPWETTGSLAASQAARPPAISIRFVIPYWCRMLAAIEER
jgi:hypothetical protein